MNFEGRVAIVTGAGNGLGRAHALALARSGCKLVVNDLQDPGMVVQEIRDGGGEAIGHAASVTDMAAVEATVGAALAAFGRVDILVNNAGVLRDRSFAKMSLEEFRLVLEVHLMGAVHCTKAVWDTMISQRYGRIVMTTSSSGLYGNFGQANYGAAKMALVGLMQTLSLEGAKHDIRVNCLAPTAATQMTQSLLPQGALDLLTPERVSPGLLHLVSEAAPSRTILTAGAGAFECANITLTRGIHLLDAFNTPDQIAAQSAALVDRVGEIVPASGITQGELELQKAGYRAP